MTMIVMLTMMPTKTSMRTIPATPSMMMMMIRTMARKPPTDQIIDSGAGVGGMARSH